MRLSPAPYIHPIKDATMPEMEIFGLLDFLDPMTLIKTLGFAGLVAIIYAESGLLIGFFFPGDSLLFTAGLLASQDFFGINIHLMVAILFLAAVLGDSTGYGFGRKMGPRIFKRPDSLLFHKENIRRAEEFYQRHGGKTIILARFMPVVRTFAPMVAGIGRMRYKRFLAFNIAGGLLWAVGLTYLGYFIGSTVGDIEKYILPIIAFIVLTSVAPPLFHVFHTKKNRQKFFASLRNLKGRKIF